jgi:fatty-acid desaturase
MKAVTAQTPPAWTTWRELSTVIARRANLKRTLTIALVVGTVFFTMNQLELVLSGHATFVVWLKVAMTYLTPLCVSNIGIASATHRAHALVESGNR